MTALLFRAEPYRRDAPGRVAAHAPDGGIVLDATLFYPAGGGQPGDAGWLDWDGGSLAITGAVRADGGAVALIPAAGAALPPVGAAVHQRLDWDLRYRHMRAHTALHLLAAVVGRPVTGGQIGPGGRGRLDFDMPEPADPAEVAAAVNALVARDLPVTEDWITDAELAANPALVRTLSVRPPAGQGRVRLVRIGQGADQVDLQPCGGTHVARTGEIGPVALGRIENKGRQNRRVPITLSG